MSDAALPSTMTRGALNLDVSLPPIMSSRGRILSAAAKRCIDIVGAIALLIVLAPVMPLLALLIRLDGGPALFSHIRIGRNGRPFGCLKFRTMSMSADAILAKHLATNPLAAAEWATQRKLTDDPRVTRIGKILRSTSLDELPQLFNVLRGEMSLVGPRPVVRVELGRHYGEAGRRAYAAVRPGITGLWQISGRSDATYVERVALDIAYNRAWSLSLDMRILLLTLPAVLSRRGAR